VTLTIVTIFDKPFTMEDANAFDRYSSTCSVGLLCSKPVMNGSTVVYEPTCCVGYVIDIFQLILFDLHVHFKLYIVADGKYGSYSYTTDSWNGMVGDVYRGKADLAIAGLTITSQRSKVVDFTVPYSVATTGIIDKPQLEQLPFANWEFMAPLSW